MLKLCDDIDTMAMTLLDGELADQELRDMELHLLGCAACKSLVERERAAHQLRRQRLAAPPAPALLRARVGRALDEIDRARRPSARSYILPGGAALAAVAALVVFLASTRGPAHPAGGRHILVDEAGARLDDQKFNVHNGRMKPNGWTISDVQLRRSGTELLGADVARLHYAVLTPDGDQLDVEAIVVDAKRIELDPAQGRLVGGYDVWVDPRSGVFVREGDRTIILGSTTLTQDELQLLISGTPLIARISTDDPRN